MKLKEFEQVLEKAGVDLPASFNLEGFIRDLGFDPSNIDEAASQVIVESLPKPKGGLAKASAKRGGINKQSPQKAPRQDAANVDDPAAALRQHFQSVDAGQRAMVEGLVSQTQERAYSDAGVMLQSMYGLTPMTLSLAAQGLGAGVEEGHFDPARFHCLGASLVAKAGVSSGEIEPSP